MVKKLLVISLILLPFLSMAQRTGPIVMQMRNGKIYFDHTYALNAGLKKKELFTRAPNWFKTLPAYRDQKINVSDDKKGEVSGTGIFKIVTSNSGHDYWTRFTVNMIVHHAT